MTQSSETWVPSFAQLNDADISTEPGVEDVHSGASGAALDGSYYSEW